MADDEITHLLPGNADAERLSYAQRVVVLEGQMALIAPVVLGQELKDGTTKPGVLRRLEAIESSIMDLGRNVKHGGIIGAVVAGAAWIISTFGLADALKHVIITTLGGKF